MEINPKRQTYDVLKDILNIFLKEMLYSGSIHVISGSIKDAVSLKHREAEAERRAER